MTTFLCVVIVLLIVAIIVVAIDKTDDTFDRPSTRDYPYWELSTKDRMIRDLEHTNYLLRKQNLELTRYPLCYFKSYLCCGADAHEVAEKVRELGAITKNLSKILEKE